ncbi:MAG: hypothetical protein L0287_24765, partial [Anaerolineae bacterium]|nr:hypothetical protein [Anaerolineae bacterium]
VFAVSHRILGLDGVILLTAVVITASILVVFRHSIHRSGSALISLLIALLVVASSSIHWLPRPHIVTFLLLAVWIKELEKLRKQKKTGIFVFPLIMLTWANLHGGFIFGFLALAAYFAGWLWDKRQNRAISEIGRQLFLVGIFSLAASILTPDLWRNWEAVLSNRSAFIFSRTVETMPPNFANLSIAPFIILLTLIVIFSLANWRNVSVSHIFLLGGLGAMSLLMMRNIPLFAIACAPILAEWISAKANHIPAWKRLDEHFVSLAAPSGLNLVPLIITAVAIGFFSYNHSQGRQVYQFNPRVFPVHVADWLEKNPIEGNMFNEFNWGGYLLFRLWPRDLVFVDSQSDFYGEPLIRDYETILLATNDWRDLLEKYNVEWIIVSPRSPLAQNLERDTGWAIRHEDSLAIIIARK